MGRIFFQGYKVDEEDVGAAILEIALSDLRQNKSASLPGRIRPS
jgi:hypothetical protein